MNSDTYHDTIDDDSKKSTPSVEEAAQIDNLKKKLYSNHLEVNAVRERGLKQHVIDVGKNWQETDEKQEALRKAQAEKERLEKLGISGDNYAHHGSSLYGHYSPSEDILRQKDTISTSLEQKTVQKNTDEESVATFLTNTFGDSTEKRVADTKKRLATTDVSMRYAASQAEGILERQIYPHIASQEEVEKQKKAEEVTVLNNYRPDFSVVTIGKNYTNDVTKETHRASSDIAFPSSEEKSPSVEDTDASQGERKKRYHFGLMIFSLVSIFFIGSLIYAYMLFKKGTQVVSPEKVTIAVTGPVSVVSGKVNDFSVDVTNNNTVDLTLSDLVVQYPIGTVSSVDTAKPLIQERISLGTIKPGETVRRKTSAVFFGEENVKKSINYAVEFSIPDATSIFSAYKDVAVVISGSPVVARITNVKEITNNQELSFDVEVQSNSEEVVKNIQLQVEYPFGYKVLESSLEPTFGNNTWNIGEISPLDTKTIRIQGKLIGTSNLEKNFRFILGVIDPASGELISTLSTQDQRVTVAKPFVTTKLSLDGSVQDIKPVTYEETIKGDVVFVNNLNVPITDVVVEVKVNGTLINRGTIQANNGFYRSGDDTMFWDKGLQERLSSIDPGDAREVSFDFSVIPSKESLIKTLRKSSATISVTIKAKRLNEKFVPEEISSVITQELRLETDMRFTSSISHVSGPFENTGLFPPRINNETTYTYTGRIANTANALKDVVFVAKLPPNGTWKNVYSETIPTSAVSYSQSKREIYIKLGDIPAGTGIDSPTKDFSFQIGFTPTLTQLNTAPVLISDMRVQGVDSFTGRTIQRGLEALSIIPKGDSGNTGAGAVVQ